LCFKLFFTSNGTRTERRSEQIDRIEKAEAKPGVDVEIDIEMDRKEDNHEDDVEKCEREEAQ
jgi:hypothetical protein